MPHTRLKKAAFARLTFQTHTLPCPLHQGWGTEGTFCNTPAFTPSSSDAVMVCSCSAPSQLILGKAAFDVLNLLRLILTLKYQFNPGEICQPGFRKQKVQPFKSLLCCSRRLKAREGDKYSLASSQKLCFCFLRPEGEGLDQMCNLWFHLVCFEFIVACNSFYGFWLCPDLGSTLEKQIIPCYCQNYIFRQGN